jgi:hypothetical protein
VPRREGGSSREWRYEIDPRHFGEVADVPRPREPDDEAAKRVGRLATRQTVRSPQAEWTERIAAGIGKRALSREVEDRGRR